MQIRFIRCLALLLVAVIAIGLCLTEVSAQKRKKRSTRKPVATTPASETTDESAATDDPKIVSTADQTASSGSGKTVKPKGTAAPTPTPESEQDALRRSIGELSGQVTKLTEKLNQMEEQQRSLVDVERLSRAEQRAEAMRSQLRDVQAKETDIQTQLDELEYALQPEIIERTVAMYGTTHPEQARDQRRKQLENQRSKLRDQFNQLEQSRVKLESAITTADSEVDALRQRLESNQQQQTPNTTPPPVKTPDYIPPPDQR